LLGWPAHASQFLALLAVTVPSFNNWRAKDSAHGLSGGMDFGSLRFLRNETDVRENLCAPLLKGMGYTIGSSCDIITEQTLQYGRQSLGKRKKTDPILRGKADYILDVDRRYRWVLEAKAPSVELTLVEREQAHTYAVHPEVKALYYVLTNGRTIEIHSTQTAPEVPPLFISEVSNLQADHQTICNILAPASIRRDFPNFVLDTGKPLAPELRSFAKIINGYLVYTAMKPALPGPTIVGMRQHLQSGSIERSDGKIIAYLKISSGLQQADDLNKSLGLDEFEVYSDAAEISTDPLNPTNFEGELTPGSRIFHPMVGKEVDFSGMAISSSAHATGYMNGKIFRGVCLIKLLMSVIPVPIEITAEFEMTLA
jgi:hypothetical protein